MNQQYVLLRKENDLLKSLIGQSFNHKSKFEAEKILDEIHCIAEPRLIGKKALCYVTDKDEIKGVGGSTLMKDKNGKIVSNLILDNLGKLLAILFSGNPSGLRGATVIDEIGTGRGIRTYTGQNFTIGNALGVVHKVGSGTTTPARSDFEVETAFGTVPESGNIDGSTPIWNSSLGIFRSTSSLTAGGSGTVNEAVLKLGMNDTTVANRFIALYRDIVSPSQAFIVGQSIALEYTIQL